jgi:23S rRNA (guanosine2251-2'-O)-methyltransferase
MADRPPDHLVFGRHAVRVFLDEKPQRVRELIVAQGRRAGAAEMMALARAAGVRIRQRPKIDLDRLTRGAAHQGLVLIVDPIAAISLESVLDLIEKKGETAGLVVVADGVQDAGNLGSIIRSAWCAGADAVVIPKDRAAGLSGTVLKTSAGAAVQVPVARVTNLARAVETLRQAGFSVVGLDPAADQVLFQVDLSRPTALVVGGEDKGLRPLVKKNCDVVARLPMAGGTKKSLNAAVATAVALFEAVRQRFGSGEG